MIQITCTSCKKVLSIDDAFAGGVCRCQYCGTIQTVPARGSAQKATAGAGKGSKTLFENKARSAGIGSGSGLDDLADVVHSSGLSDARLRKEPSPAARPAKNLIPLLGLAVAVILALLIVLLMVIFHGPTTPKANSTDAGPNSSVSETSPPPTPANVVLSPTFCGMPIDQSVVVYVIDNGSSSATVLDAIKLAMFKSIESLGSNGRFQILFWNPDTDAYPTEKTAFAVHDNIEAARKKLQDVTASGSTDPLSAIQKAIAADDPGQIILVTAKAADLDPSLVDKVVTLRGSSTVPIDCFAINGVPGDKVMSQIAAKTGGKFVPISEAQLKGFGF